MTPGIQFRVVNLAGPGDALAAVVVALLTRSLQPPDTVPAAQPTRETVAS